jgi:phosphoribosylformimino-5-aminoimidazole carboxamide ribotide isomerase
VEGAWLQTPIEVVPAVDILGGEAVRLRRGDPDDVVETPGDPAALARRFAAAGFGRVHLVDLTGARSGRVRPQLVRDVAAAIVPAAVQAAGGVRTRADAWALVEAGADRVVVGTKAFPDPQPWVEALGDRLLVAIDVREGTVRTAGWTQEGLALDDALERASAAGVSRVLCTAIDRDGTLAGPDTELVASIAAAGFLVVAAGGIRSPDDVAAVAAAGAEAAVVGRALLARGRDVTRHGSR